MRGACVAQLRCTVGVSSCWGEVGMARMVMGSGFAVFARDRFAHLRLTQQNEAVCRR